MAKIQITESDIQNMVYEALSRMLNEDTLEKQTGKGNSKQVSDDKNDSLHAWLNDDKTDQAAVAKDLWPNEEENSRRSKFYKYLDHDPYKLEDGTTRHYDFSPEEKSKLYAIMQGK